MSDFMKKDKIVQNSTFKVKQRQEGWSKKQAKTAGSMLKALHSDVVLQSVSFVDEMSRNEMEKAYENGYLDQIKSSKDVEADREMKHAREKAHSKAKKALELHKELMKLADDGTDYDELVKGNAAFNKVVNNISGPMSKGMKSSAKKVFTRGLRLMHALESISAMAEKHPEYNALRLFAKQSLFEAENEWRCISETARIDVSEQKIGNNDWVVFDHEEMSDEELENMMQEDAKKDAALDKDLKELIKEDEERDAALGEEIDELLQEDQQENKSVEKGSADDEVNKLLKEAGLNEAEGNKKLTEDQLKKVFEEAELEVKAEEDDDDIDLDEEYDDIDLDEEYDDLSFTDEEKEVLRKAGIKVDDDKARDVSDEEVKKFLQQVEENGGNIDEEEELDEETQVNNLLKQAEREVNAEKEASPLMMTDSNATVHAQQMQQDEILGEEMQQDEKNNGKFTDKIRIMLNRRDLLEPQEDDSEEMKTLKGSAKTLWLRYRDIMAQVKSQKKLPNDKKNIWHVLVRAVPSICEALLEQAKEEHKSIEGSLPQRLLFESIQMDYEVHGFKIPFEGARKIANTKLYKTYKANRSSESYEKDAANLTGGVAVSSIEK